jgi:hypothetical protein
LAHKSSHRIKDGKSLLRVVDLLNMHGRVTPCILNRT